MNKTKGLTKYQFLPPLKDEEMTALRADIVKRGVMVPIELDDEGNILDGHNRAAIADELEIECPEIIRQFENESQKKEHVLKLNLARRHMDPIRWGLTFKLLLEERGGVVKQGCRNDTTSSTVKEVAEELGVAKSTAEYRLRAARLYDSLPAKEKKAVDSGKQTVHKAARSVKRQKEIDVQVEAAKTRVEAAPPAAQTWEIIQGDCRDILYTLEAESARLVFMDPPYNIRYDYGEGEHDDDMPTDKYLDMLKIAIDGSARALTADGSMWFLINHEWAADAEIMIQDCGLFMRSWITWFESFGVNVASGFNRCSRRLLHAVRDPRQFVFNEDAVRRSSDRQTKYKDARANPDGKIWDDVWGINPPIHRLSGTCKERIPDLPTQLPLALLLPIVGCASEPGDLVVDPFCGGATSGVAARTLGRQYIGIEKSEQFAKIAHQRLLITQEETHVDPT
jgi:site-specific DNA-methyltransferase (adenine-specific)